MAILLDQFTYKSWILMLKSKKDFFNIFKLSFLRAKAYRSKLHYIQIDNGGEFISTVFQTFYKEQGTKIRYAALYIYKENDIA